jgi:RNA 3'-terminal phosphate cyclase (ATP)
MLTKLIDFSKRLLCALRLEEWDSLIEIPGDILEGGGQILRTSLSLAALLQKGVVIKNIRSKRIPPGLKAQHLTSVRAITEITKAKAEGFQVGSMNIQFSPQEINGGNYRFDIGTAGSITLILQALIPISIYANKPLQVQLTGGTDVRWSPSIDYLNSVILPNLSLMGFTPSLIINRRGYYPKGGGRITFTSTPTKYLKSINLVNPGDIKCIQGISHCGNLPRHIAERQAKTAIKLLKPITDDITIKIQTGVTSCPGSGITLTAISKSGIILGSDSLGERGKPAERVGSEAANKLLDELSTEMVLDRHMGDVIIPYLALAQGRSRLTISRITSHTLTNIKITELITKVHFSIQGELNKSGEISVEGLGMGL